MASTASIAVNPEPSALVTVLTASSLTLAAPGFVVQAVTGTRDFMCNRPATDW
jgi:hypothetical protein